MVAQNQLIHEIETLSADYFDEVFDFIGYLKAKPVVSAGLDTKMRPERAATAKKNIEWLKHPWKMDNFTPLARDEIYDRT
ncbi:MAG: hypothetical protein Ta2A_14050 [Treponemataceae bacterium]|nr:MAG: hypothetical protein Ta2A_14050 [Treponemataceae bacterium]